MMIAQLFPPLPIAAAFAASLAMPLLLAGYARGPFARFSLGQRFWMAMGTAAGAWTAAIAAYASGFASGASVGLIVDVSAGLAILLTAGLVVYSVWSLACFGFTLSMLVCLSSSGGALSLDAWADSYAEGRGMGAFTRDRVAVLVGMGLAVEEGERIRLNGAFALRFAKLVRLVSGIFAMRMDA